MKEMKFSEAIDDVIAEHMVLDPSIVVFGEDVLLLRRDLLARFGNKRILNTPISESAFVGAAVTAAMGGLRPIVEVYMADFLCVCMDALVNHAAKVNAFSGGSWNVPMVLRVPCGGGYGDGGQHGQSLWGWLAHIPGLAVAVPSNPADAGGLMAQAFIHEGPTLFFEHKLLSASWLEFLGSGARSTVEFDVPAAGAIAEVPPTWVPIQYGVSRKIRDGGDLTIVSVGVSVHRAVRAAEILQQEDGISASVVDLRTVAPLDAEGILAAAEQSGCVLVVDEDYGAFGLSGEVSAIIAEAGLSCKYARVCTGDTIPYDRRREDEMLPNVARIASAARSLTSS